MNQLLCEEIITNLEIIDENILDNIQGKLKHIILSKKPSISSLKLATKLMNNSKGSLTRNVKKMTNSFKTSTPGAAVRVNAALVAIFTLLMLA